VGGAGNCYCDWCANQWSCYLCLRLPSTVARFNGMEQAGSLANTRGQRGREPRKSGPGRVTRTRIRNEYRNETGAVDCHARMRGGHRSYDVALIGNEFGATRAPTCRPVAGDHGVTSMEAQQTFYPARHISEQDATTYHEMTLTDKEIEAILVGDAEASA
jgi:hypothetical protein